MFLLYLTGDRWRWRTLGHEERTVVHSGLVKIGQLRRGGDRMKLVLILVILILGSAAVQLDCTEQESKFYLEKKLQRQ